MATRSHSHKQSCIRSVKKAVPFVSEGFRDFRSLTKVVMASSWISSVFGIVCSNRRRIPQHLALPFLMVVLLLPQCFVKAQDIPQGPGDEGCETLPSEIHIIKEEFDELGRLQRTCNGEVAVNKCEGACSSQVQPSVITPTGFLKECYCCRESFLRERIITLTNCFDPDGGRLRGSDTETMNVKLREPAECRCFKCGEFSR